MLHSYNKKKMGCKHTTGINSNYPVFLYWHGMGILKKIPHLILLMPETYYAKMANLAALSEEKHGLNVTDFPQISDWFYGKTKENTMLCVDIHTH